MIATVQVFRRRIRSAPAGPAGSFWRWEEEYGRYLRYVASVTTPPEAADGFLSTPVYLEGVTVPLWGPTGHYVSGVVDVSLTFHWNTDSDPSTHAAIHLAGMSTLSAGHTLAPGWRGAIVEALNAAHPETTDENGYICLD